MLETEYKRDLLHQAARRAWAQTVDPPDDEFLRRPIEHEAKPVRDCQWHDTEIPDPDGRVTWKNGGPWRWPQLEWCIHNFRPAFDYWLAVLGDEGPVDDDVFGKPTVCVVITERDVRKTELWMDTHHSFDKHHHLCADCYRRGFGTE